ncbi:MAG: hypothetical protein SOW32_00275 [Agathobacter sp.]|nr:hypothetical protein [Agathobacter sp.]
MRKKIFLVISEEDTICPECGSPLCRRDRKLRVHKEAGDEYRSLLDDIKTAKYRIETLEYVVEKTNYFDNSENQAEYFYDTELNDYVENLGFNIIAMIVVLLIVIPMYTEDFYSGTVSMIKSSKNGRKVLFISRLKITMVISTVVYVLFAATEFVTKDLLFELGNLNACIGNLMIDRIADLPNSFINLSIWKFIVFLYLIYLVEAMLLAVIGLVVSKVSRGNIEAFTIMSVVLVGKQLFVLLM